MTKLEVMESYWSRYGIATSAFQMAGELRKKWPLKVKDSYLQECIDFIRRKKNELSCSRPKTCLLEQMIAKIIPALERNLSGMYWEPRY